MENMLVNILLASVPTLGYAVIVSVIVMSIYYIMGKETRQQNKEVFTTFWKIGGIVLVAFLFLNIINSPMVRPVNSVYEEPARAYKAPMQFPELEDRTANKNSEPKIIEGTPMFDKAVERLQ